MRSKCLAFTKADVGCYADGSYGQQHARDVLYGLLVDCELGEQPLSDEDEAIELLQDVTSAELVWGFVDGDLIPMIDPNQNLRHQYNLAFTILHDWSMKGIKDVLADELAQLVLKLDEHISNGGQLPDQWAIRSQDSRFVKIKEKA